MGLLSLAAGYFYWQAASRRGGRWCSPRSRSRRWHVMAARSSGIRCSHRGLREPPLLAAVAVTVISRWFSSTSAPGRLFTTVPLSPMDLALCVVLSGAVFWGMELRKWIVRRGAVPPAAPGDVTEVCDGDRAGDSRPVHVWPPRRLGGPRVAAGGLSAAEAAGRLARFGPNAIREVRGRPLVLRFLANFTHLMALLLWAGGLIGFLARMPQLGIAIWSVNLINGIFSFWQEYRAEKAAEALRRLLPAHARVLRDGASGASPPRSSSRRRAASRGGRPHLRRRPAHAGGGTPDRPVHLTGSRIRHARRAMRCRETGSPASRCPTSSSRGRAWRPAAGRRSSSPRGWRPSSDDRPSHPKRAGGTEPAPERDGRATRVVSALAVGAGSLLRPRGPAGRMTLAEGFIFRPRDDRRIRARGMVPTVSLSLAMGCSGWPAGRPGQAAFGGGNARVHVGHLHRQDRDADAERNDGPEIRLAGRRLVAAGVGYAPRGDHGRRQTRRRGGGRGSAGAPRRRRALQQRALVRRTIGPAGGRCSGTPPRRRSSWRPPRAAWISRPRRHGSRGCGRSRSIRGGSG